MVGDCFVGVFFSWLIMVVCGDTCLKIFNVLWPYVYVGTIIWVS